MRYKLFGHKTTTRFSHVVPRRLFNSTLPFHCAGHSIVLGYDSRKIHMYIRQLPGTWYDRTTHVPTDLCTVAVQAYQVCCTLRRSNMHAGQVNKIDIDWWWIAKQTKNNSKDRVGSWKSVRWSCRRVPPTCLSLSFARREEYGRSAAATALHRTYM